MHESMCSGLKVKFLRCAGGHHGFDPPMKNAGIFGMDLGAILQG